MREQVWADVPLARCSHWFTGCWFKSKSLNIPVYVKNTTKEKLFVIDALGINHLLKLEDIDVSTPDLGYTEFRSRDTRGNTTWNVLYLTYNGYKSWKKGLESSRINYQKLVGDSTYDPEKGETGWNVKAERGNLNFRMDKHPEFAHAVFKQSKRGFKEADELLKQTGYDQMVLSENFSLMKSQFRHFDNNLTYLLCYRCSPIAHVSNVKRGNKVIIDIDERLLFLSQHIQAEINDVQIVGL